MSDAAATPANSAAPSGERRQVTVLFADMAGFTAVSERLGEEGTFALIQPIYELMAGAVKEQGGRSRTSPATASWRCSAFLMRSKSASARLPRGIAYPPTPSRRRPGH